VAQKAILSFKSRFPYISEKDEARDFKFGMQLGFAKAHHQIPLEEKVDVALGLGSSPKFGTFPLIFLERLRIASLNLVDSLDLPRPIIKSHPDEKWGWPRAREPHRNFGFPYYISATAGASDFQFGTQLLFAKAHHKITHRRKGGRGPGLGELSKIFFVPLLYLHTG